MAMKNKKTYKLPPFKAKAVDTTGAGDIYAAGVLWGLARKMPLEKSCRLGSMLAAKVVERIGARLGKENIKEILARI